MSMAFIIHQAKLCRKVIAHLYQLSQIKTYRYKLANDLIWNATHYNKPHMQCDELYSLLKETERVNSITNLKTTGAVCHRSSAWRGQGNGASQSVPECERQRQRQEGWQEKMHLQKGQLVHHRWQSELNQRGQPQDKHVLSKARGVKRI